MIRPLLANVESFRQANLLRLAHSLCLIHMSLQEKVLPVEGAFDFLKAAGFDQQTLLYNESEEDFLVWSPDDCSIQELLILNDALKSAEQIPIELDRNLQVLMPCQARLRNELPPSFFTISVEDIKKEQQLR